MYSVKPLFEPLLRYFMLLFNFKKFGLACRQITYSMGVITAYISAPINIKEYCLILTY